MSQPVLRQFLHQVGERILDALEIGPEDAIKTVEIGFVLDQKTGPGQVVEVVNALAGEPAPHRLEQGQELRDGRV